jgi:hypothetical protein
VIENIRLRLHGHGPELQSRQVGCEALLRDKT